MGKKILIVNVNWVGDVLFSTPFIRAVRSANPDGHIACLLHPRCREVLEGNPRLDEIIIYDEGGEHKSLLGKMKLVSALKKRRFDTAYILHRSFTKALLVRMAGIPERVGYPTKRRAFVLTKTIDSPAEELHKVDYFLNIARACGIEAKDRSYEFFIAERDRSAVKASLAERGVNASDRVVVICPGGNWNPKRWPKENFARLSDILIGSFGVRIAIAGAKKDVHLAEEIRALMRNEPVITCGKTTLKELGALLERACLVIANDTGPMHLAVAMKARTIALFGPTAPAVTGPYGAGEYRVISKHEGCQVPCYDFSCTVNRCMATITVEEVLRSAEEMLLNNSNAQIKNR